MQEVGAALESLLNSRSHDLAVLYEFYPMTADRVNDPGDAVGLFSSMSINFDAFTYTRLVTSTPTIKRFVTSTANSATITFSNLDRQIAAFIQSNDLAGMFLVIRCISSSASTSLSNSNIILYTGTIEKADVVDNQAAVINARQYIHGIEQEFPPRQFGPKCPLTFKEEECQGGPGGGGGNTNYDNALTCNKSHNQCDFYGNTANFQGIRLVSQEGSFTWTTKERRGGFLGALGFKKKVRHYGHWSTQDETPIDSPIPVILGRAQCEALPLASNDTGGNIYFLTALSMGKNLALTNIRSQTQGFSQPQGVNVHLGDFGNTGTNLPDSYFPNSGFFSRLSYIGAFVTGSKQETKDKTPEITALVMGMSMPVAGNDGGWKSDGWSDNPIDHTRWILTDSRCLGMPVRLMNDGVNYETWQHCQEPLVDLTNGESVFLPNNQSGKAGVDYHRYYSSGIINTFYYRYWQLALDSIPDVFRDNVYNLYDPATPPANIPPPTLLRRRYTFNAQVRERSKLIDFLFKVLLPSYRGYLVQGQDGRIQIKCERPTEYGYIRASIGEGIPGWFQQQGVTITSSPNQVAKNVPTNGWGEAAVTSGERVQAGDFSFEFKMSQAQMAGLTTHDSIEGSFSFDQLRHAFSRGVGTPGDWAIYENGGAVGVTGTFTEPTDLFEIKYESGSVNYYVAGVLVHTSALSPVYPIRAGAALHNAAAVLIDAFIRSGNAPVSVPTATVPSWNQQLNVTISTVPDNQVTRTAFGPAAWGNAAVTSFDQIASGDWSFEFRFPAGGGQFAGVTNQAALTGPTSYDGIRYGMHADITTPGAGYIYENGVFITGFSFTPGVTLFEIKHESGVVNYYVGGVLTHTSALSPIYPVGVGAAFYTPSTAMADAIIRASKTTSIVQVDDVNDFRRFTTWQTEDINWSALKGATVLFGSNGLKLPAGSGAQGGALSEEKVSGINFDLVFTIVSYGVFYVAFNQGEAPTFNRLDHAFKVDKYGITPVLAACYEEASNDSLSQGAGGAVANGYEVRIAMEDGVFKTYTRPTPGSGIWNPGFKSTIRLTRPIYSIQFLADPGSADDSTIDDLILTQTRTTEVLISPNEFNSEIRIAQGFEYSAAGNSVPIVAGATGGVTLTASGATLAGGTPTIAPRGFYTVGGTPANGNTVTATVDGFAVSYTCNANDTTGTVAGMLYSTLSANPTLKRYLEFFWSPSAPTIINVRSKLGSVVLDSSLIYFHSVLDEFLRISAHFDQDNILPNSMKWPLGSRQSSVNQVKLKYREASQDWALVEIRENDTDHQSKVRKTLPDEIDGLGIDSYHQADRLVAARIAKLRDLDFFYSWQASAFGKALLLEEGDIVAVSALSGGYRQIPVRLEDLQIQIANLDFTVSCVGRIYATRSFIDAPGETSVILPTNLPYTENPPGQVTGLTITQPGGGVEPATLRGEFTFAAYPGRQTARVQLKRAGAGSFTDTGIIVTPDSANKGFFEIGNLPVGVHDVKVIPENDFGTGAASGGAATGGTTFTPSPAGAINIKESDASPDITSVSILVVPKDTLTNDGGGQATFAPISGVDFRLDGGASPLPLGLAGFARVPYDCQILGVRLFADQTGSVEIELWADVYANYPPTIADSIVASARPTITTGVKYEDVTLTGWTTALTKGMILAVVVNSVTAIQKLTISLEVKRT